MEAVLLAVLRMLLLGSLVITGIALAGYIAAAVLRDAGAALRSRVYLAAGLACLLVAFLAANGSGFPAWYQHLLAGLGTGLPAPSRLPLIVGVWLAVTLLATTSGAVGLWRLRRLRDRAVPIERRAMRRLLESAAGAMDVRVTVRLRASREIAVPLTFGVIRPTILLPSGAADWTDCRLRAVLLHELAHIRRRDWAALIALRSMAAVLWFHPAAHWLLARFQWEAELACDERVIAAGTAPITYAEHLLALAHASRGTVFPALGFSGPARRLERRLSAVLCPLPHRSSFTRASVTLTALTALVVLAAAVSLPSTMCTASATTPPSVTAATN